MLQVYESNVGMRRINITNATRLDIGCGPCKKPGWTGMDVKDLGQEILWDVRNGIPVPDNSIEAIYSGHFLEHLDDADIEALYYELYRVCKQGALIEFIVPHMDHACAYVHNHKSFWSELRFKGLVQSSEPPRFAIEKTLRVLHETSKCDQLVVVLKVINKNVGSFEVG